jgi:hypothetical protein
MKKVKQLLRQPSPMTITGWRIRSIGYDNQKAKWQWGHQPYNPTNHLLAQIVAPHFLIGRR